MLVFIFFTGCTVAYNMHCLCTAVELSRIRTKLSVIDNVLFAWNCFQQRAAKRHIKVINVFQLEMFPLLKSFVYLSSVECDYFIRPESVLPLLMRMCGHNALMQTVKTIVVFHPSECVVTWALCFTLVFFQTMNLISVGDLNFRNSN